MSEEKENIIQALDSFKNKKVLVIGDIILDQYIYGDVSRISPEAPVQVLKFEKEKNIPGGAGNTANNLAALGAKVLITGVVGGDSKKITLIQELQKIGVNTDGIFTDPNRPTITKQRLVGGNGQQLLRLDFEETHHFSEAILQNLISYVREKIDGVDALVISDYAKGLVNRPFIRDIVNLAYSKNKPVIVDGKPKNLECFVDVTLMTPNFKEAKEMTGLEDDNIEIIGKKLVQKLNANIFITRGPEGISIFEKNGNIKHVPTKKVKVFDVTGAGDTVVAISTLGLASGLNLQDIADLSNTAGRIVVQKQGTSTVNVQELKESLNASKVDILRKQVPKVWGAEDWIVNYENSNFCGKRLLLKKAHQCSIHYHKIKSEVFYINQGLVLMQAYGKDRLMKPGESILIEPGTKHRFIGITDAEIIEFSSHHKDEDNYRDEPSSMITDDVFTSYLQRYANEINTFQNEQSNFSR